MTNPDTTTHPTDEEQALLEQFRALGNHGKGFVLDALLDAKDRDTFGPEPFFALNGFHWFATETITGRGVDYATSYKPEELARLAAIWQEVQQIEAAAEARCLEREQQAEHREQTAAELTALLADLTPTEEQTLLGFGTAVAAVLKNGGTYEEAGAAGAAYCVANGLPVPASLAKATDETTLPTA